MPVTMRQHVIAIIVVSVVFLIVGSLDYEDEASEMIHYCEMVESGAWPNYKDLDCEYGDEDGSSRRN